MTAPHHALGLEDSTTHSSDTTAETNFNSPATYGSPITAGGTERRVSATNQHSGFSSSQTETVPAQPAYISKGASVAASRDQSAPFTSLTSDFNQPPQAIQRIRPDDSDQQYPPFAATPYSTLAATATEPWTSRSAPYLFFTPQPRYEPTGELIDEQFDSFLQFDDPSRTGAVANQADSEFVPKSTLQAKSGESGRAANPIVQLHQSKSPVETLPPQGFPLPQKSALKRKAGYHESIVSEFTDNKTFSRPAAKVRSVSFEDMSAREAGSPNETSGRASFGQLRGGASLPPGRRSRPSTPSSTPNASVETEGTLPFSAASRPNRGVKHPSGHPPSILPPEKVFPIQIGSDLFRLSGASISSDAPSYFTQFFEEQIRENSESGGVRTLYIDRDPETFRDVARHLQGYYVKPRDGSHFVKLFADAQFYSLPRLIDQLFESEIFIQIGERHFQIPKDIFSEAGNSPNFFSLGFAVFFSTPGEVFPGLDRRGLLRPPSITPPYVPNRSADIFAELLHLLRGYPLKVRDENHRQELLRDCRYFHLRGLEQKIIAHEVSYNLGRGRYEIALRLEDVKPSGVSFRPNDDNDDDDDNETDGKGNDEEQEGRSSVAMMTDSSNVSTENHVKYSSTRGWVNYARPFVDESSYELVVEIGSEQTQLDLRDMRVDFHGLTKARVSSLFQVVANKMNLPTNAPLGLMLLGGGDGGAPITTQGSSPGHTPLSEDRVKVRFEVASAIYVDGEKWEADWESELGKRMRFGPEGMGSGGKRKHRDADYEEDDDDDEEEEGQDDDSDEDNDSVSNDEMTDDQGQQQHPTAQRSNPSARGKGQGQRGAATASSSTQQQPQQQLRQRAQHNSTAPPRPQRSTQQHQPDMSSSRGVSKKRKRPAGGGGGDAPSTTLTNPLAAQTTTAAAAIARTPPSTLLHHQSPTWTIKTGLYRLRVQPAPSEGRKSGRGGRRSQGLEIVFVVVKIDAWRGEKARNERRGFLGG